MSIRDELKDLSFQMKRSIARTARKLLSEQPNIHTIVVDKKPGVKTGREYTDFELLLFYNAETEEETRRIISESSFYGGSGEVSKNYQIFNPGRGYLESDRTVQSDETWALLYKFRDNHTRKEPDYMAFLQEHLNFFTKSDYLGVTSLNTPEMEKSNPLFSSLYTTYHSEKGYLLFNKQVKPFITMHIELSD